MTVPAGVASTGIAFFTQHSSFDTTIAVYTTNGPLEPSFLTLVPVAKNDDHQANYKANSQTYKWSQVVVPATPGVVYFIAVDGSTSTAEGAVWLAFHHCVLPRPKWYDAC